MVLSQHDINGSCECGYEIHGASICDLEQERVTLTMCYCMTYSEDTNDVVAGLCYYSCFNGTSGGIHYPVPPNVSELNDMTCGYAN